MQLAGKLDYHVSKALPGLMRSWLGSFGEGGSKRASEIDSLVFHMFVVGGSSRGQIKRSTSKKNSIFKTDGIMPGMVRAYVPARIEQEKKKKRRKKP